MRADRLLARDLHLPRVRPRRSTPGPSRGETPTPPVTPGADGADKFDRRDVDVKWTLAAEAREYRETLLIEESLKRDPEYQKRWLERQAEREIELEEDEQVDADGVLSFMNADEED